MLSNNTYTIARYIIDRLEQCGIRHLFGIPGDYILPFFDELVSNRNGLQHIGNCNELNATFAANGYARINKTLGACAVTYGPGAFNAVNGVAEAMSDNVPIILISGAPNTKEYSRQPVNLLHHVVGTNLDASLDIFKPITLAAQRLMSAKNAKKEIDQLLRIAIDEKGPVYLEIPYDLQITEISKVDEWDCALRRSDFNDLDSIATRIGDLISKAKSTILLPGKWVERNHLEEDFIRFVKDAQLLFATSFDAKAAYAEKMDQCIGFYQGEMSGPIITPIFKNADLIIGIGFEMTEFNTGMFSNHMKESDMILLNHDHVVIKGKRFEKIYLRDLLPELIKRIPQITRSNSVHKKQNGFIYNNEEAFEPSENKKITIDAMYRMLPHFLKRGDIIAGDTGGYLNGTRLEHPHYSTSIGNANWGSLGFGFCAAVGACFASGDTRRVICLEGDGSFQMVAQELSVLAKYNKNIILIILNNAGYTAERAIEPEIYDSYNDIQVWNYHDLPKVFGDTHFFGMEIFTEIDFLNALRKAEVLTGRVILNVHLAKLDIAKFNLNMSAKMKH